MSHQADSDRFEPRVVMFDAAYPPPFIGGKEKQAHLLSCALRDLAVSVRVLTLKLSADQPREFDGIEVTRCPAGTSRFAAIFRHLGQWRSGNNICHVHTPSRIGIYTGLVAKWLGYRVIFKIPNENLTASLGESRLWTAALRTFDRLIVLDEKTRQEYEDARVDPGRIVLGSNGVVVQERRAPTFEPGKPVQLLFLGRLVDQKGCRELLAAAKLLKEHESDQRLTWYLTMLGSGPLEAELHATIESLGLSDRVALKPWRDDVYAGLREADVLVVPSHREGMPNVVLEAMSVGVSVVATDVGAVTRLLGEESGSFIVAPNDVERFADAMQTLVKDPAMRDAYGAALHARARRFFDMPVIAGQYELMYRQVLGMKNAERRIES